MSVQEVIFYIVAGVAVLAALGVVLSGDIVHSALFLILALLKKPPLPSLFAGVLLGALVAIFLQGRGLHEVFTYAQ